MVEPGARGPSSGGSPSPGVCAGAQSARDVAGGGSGSQGLKRRRDFLRVQERGKRLFSGEVLVLAVDSGRSGPRIGITVSSRVGNAVERNRVKRWVREAWRAVRSDFPAVDLVVVARPGAVRMGLAGARQALVAARQGLEKRRGS